MRARHQLGPIVDELKRNAELGDSRRSERLLKVAEALETTRKSFHRGRSAEADFRSQQSGVSIKVVRIV